MSKKERLYKCYYKHCDKFGKVSEKDTSITKVGNRRFHGKCYQDHQDLKKARELYIEYIQPDVVHSQLNKVINEIIEKRKLSADYILFVIEYIIENNLEINYPYGLYYKVSDYKIKRAYNEQSIITKTINIYS